MIKASEGGGGKGIRKANNDEEFSNGFRQVRKLSFSADEIEIDFKQIGVIKYQTVFYSIGLKFKYF